MTRSTRDPARWASRAVAHSARDDLHRRAKQIQNGNLGHQWAAAFAAAEREADAIERVINAKGAAQTAARLALRAVQLQCTNLDLPNADALHLARVQMGAEADATPL